MKATLIDQTKLTHVATAVPPLYGNFETHFYRIRFHLIIKQKKKRIPTEFVTIPIVKIKKLYKKF
ncbi:hypothetical protein A5844_000238, partial [Enterococcus sp. 10A9_DIV0425]